MTRLGALLAAVAAVPVTTLTVATGTASATAPSASIQLENQAQLQPDGSVLLTFDYLCNPGISGSGGVLQASLEQQSPPAGSALGEPATCNDQKHQLTLHLGGSFHRGSASASAMVSNSDLDSSASTQAEVAVK
jgi:hypothetical protein